MKKNKIVILMLMFVFSLAQAQDKPNVLWITLEDISPQFVGCYGNEDVHTPNIDKIASEGIRFDRAYSNATVCAPSRSTIITGCRNEVIGTGNHRSGVPIPDTICGFPTYMRNLGYYTANVGKTDYNTKNAKAIIKSSWNINSGKGSWKGRAEGQPFFAMFNVFECHQSRTMTMPFAYYENEILPRLSDSLVSEMGGLKMPPIYRNTPEMQKYLARTYNSVNAADVHVGKILSRLKADGLMDETIIFIFGDHGEAIPRGKGSPIALGHRIPFIAWFPEKYKHLSPWKSGEPTEEQVCFEDLGPTMLSLTGAEIPDYMHGRPLLGEKRVEGERCIFGSRNRLDAAPGMMRSVMMGDYVYTRSFQPYLPMLKYKHYHDVAEITQAIRRDYEAGKLNEVQSLMLKRNETESLYNIKEDVWETKNLAESEEHKKILKQLQDSLWQNMLNNRDIHLFPEYEIDLMTEAGKLPYNERMNDELLPVKELIECVKLIGMGDKVVPQQLEFLFHKNKIVRYWAAVGLNSQTADLTPFAEEIRKALNDSYPPVQIEVASVLVKQSEGKEARETLKKYITSDDANLSNQAVQMVQHFDKEKAGMYKGELMLITGNKNKRIAFPAEVALYYLYQTPRIFAGKSEDFYRPYSEYTFEGNTKDIYRHSDFTGDVKQTEDGKADFTKTSGLEFDNNFFLSGEFSICFDVNPKVTRKAELISLSDKQGGNRLTLKLAKGKLRLVLNGETAMAESSLEAGKWTNVKLIYSKSGFEIYQNDKLKMKLDKKYSVEYVAKGKVGKGFTGLMDNFRIYHFAIHQNELESHKL